MRKDSCRRFVLNRSPPTSTSLTDEQVRVGTKSHLRRNGRKGLSFVKKNFPQGHAMACWCASIVLKNTSKYR